MCLSPRHLLGRMESNSKPRPPAPSFSAVFASNFHSAWLRQYAAFMISSIKEIYGKMVILECSGCPIHCRANICASRGMCNQLFYYFHSFGSKYIRRVPIFKKQKWKEPWKFKSVAFMPVLGKVKTTCQVACAWVLRKEYYHLPGANKLYQTNLNSFSHKVTNFIVQADDLL